MTNLVDKVDSIEAKIRKLLELRISLEQENLQLKKKIGFRKSEIKDLQNEIESLKEDNQMLKAANALLGSNEFRRETKLKINSLIKDIDYCIAQLSE